jgi:hypothetical protein
VPGHHLVCQKEIRLMASKIYHDPWQRVRREEFGILSQSWKLWRFAFVRIGYLPEQSLTPYT